MPYTTGTKTFTAYEDITENRVVMLRTSSVEPTEVQLAHNDSADFYGISVTSADAGSLISIMPFDKDGTYQIESSGVITKGNRVYVSTTNDGRINDEETVTFVGVALTKSDAAGELVSVASVQEHVLSDASDVTIVDAGGYYTSSNVEGALQEAGSDIDALETLTSALPAANVTIVDTGAYFSSSHVEGALQEVGADLNALPASNVTITDTADHYTSTDVEGALTEIGDIIYPDDTFTEYIPVNDARFLKDGITPQTIAQGGGLFTADPWVGGVRPNDSHFVATAVGSDPGRMRLVWEAGEVGVDGHEYVTFLLRPRYPVDTTSSTNPIFRLHYDTDTATSVNGAAEVRMTKYEYNGVHTVSLTSPPVNLVLSGSPGLLSIGELPSSHFADTSMLIITVHFYTGGTIISGGDLSMYGINFQYPINNRFMAT